MIKSSKEVCTSRSRTTCFLAAVGPKCATLDDLTVLMMVEISAENVARMVADSRNVSRSRSSTSTETGSGDAWVSYTFPSSASQYFQTLTRRPSRPMDSNAPIALRCFAAAARRLLNAREA